MNNFFVVVEKWASCPDHGHEKKKSPEMLGQESNCQGSLNDVYKFHPEESVFLAKNCPVQSWCQLADSIIENGNTPRTYLGEL